MLFFQAVLVADAVGARSAHAVCLAEQPSVLLDAQPALRLIEHERAFAYAGWSHRNIADLGVWVPDNSTPETVEQWFRAQRAQLLHGGTVSADGLSAELRAPKESRTETDLDSLMDSIVVRTRRLHLRAPLRLNRLSLSTFRGIAKLDLDLHEGVTVLAGPNGSGKSTVLDALGLALSHLTARIEKNPKNAPSLVDNDIMSQQSSARLSVRGSLGTQELSCTLRRTREVGPLFVVKEEDDLSGLDSVVEALHGNLARGDICLPVVAKYPVNRAVLDIPLRIKNPHVFEPVEAYEGAYHGTGRNFRLFFEWFRNREDLENQFRIERPIHRDHQLQAVRRAIASVIPELSEPRVQRAPLGLLVKKGPLLLFVDQLSDGEKCLMAMVGDLARRLAMANPYADDPLRGGGVVLIDEVELHLHPGWQRRLIPGLQKTFPGCQFILTTHSPAVLSHVDRDAVFLLRPTDEGIMVERPDVSKGAECDQGPLWAAMGAMVGADKEGQVASL